MTLAWAVLRPVDHPAQIDLTDDAVEYFALAQAGID